MRWVRETEVRRTSISRPSRRRSHLSHRVRVGCVAAGLTVTGVSLGHAAEPSWDAAFAAARAAYESGRYRDATPLAEHALSDARQRFGSYDPHTIDALVLLGDLQSVMAQYDRAQTQYQEVLAGREQMFGSRDLSVADALVKLAELQILQEHLAEARPLCQRALAIYDRANVQPTLSMVRALILLAHVDIAHSHTADALAPCQRALDLLNRIVGKALAEQLLAARNYAWLARVYGRAGQAERAQALAQRALDTQEHLLGSSHPQLAETLMILAEIYLLEGETVRAGTLYERAVAILEKSLGSQHPYVTYAMKMLAQIYTSEGQTEQADAIRERISAATGQPDSEQPPRRAPLARNDGEQGGNDRSHRFIAMAESLRNRAEVYVQLGSYAEAETLFRESLDIYQKGIGADAPESVAVMKEYAALLHKMGKHNEARALEGRTQQIQSGGRVPK